MVKSPAAHATWFLNLEIDECGALKGGLKSMHPHAQPVLSNCQPSLTLVLPLHISPLPT